MASGGADFAAGDKVTTSAGVLIGTVASSSGTSITIDGAATSVLTNAFLHKKSANALVDGVSTIVDVASGGGVFQAGDQLYTPAGLLVGTVDAATAPTDTQITLVAASLEDVAVGVEMRRVCSESSCVYGGGSIELVAGNGDQPSDDNANRVDNGGSIEITIPKANQITMWDLPNAASTYTHTSLNAAHKAGSQATYGGASPAGKEKFVHGGVGGAITITGGAGLGAASTGGAVSLRGADYTLSNKYVKAGSIKVTAGTSSAGTDRKSVV